MTTTQQQQHPVSSSTRAPRAVCVSFRDGVRSSSPGRRGTIIHLFGRERSNWVLPISLPLPPPSNRASFGAFCDAIAAAAPSFPPPSFLILIHPPSFTVGARGGAAATAVNPSSLSFQSWSRLKGLARLPHCILQQRCAMCLVSSLFGGRARVGISPVVKRRRSAAARSEMRIRNELDCADDRLACSFRNTLAAIRISAATF